jgi:ubiquinone/menaquinone biosynthesis C-methylase UbiE
MATTTTNFAARLGRVFGRKRARLRINYELAPVPTAAVENHAGTHLNESGDDRSTEKYLAQFDLAAELANPVVAENLEFLDRVVSPLLPRDAEIADVGCGIGRYARFLRRPTAPTAHWRYSGVDRSEAILGYARRLCPDCEFRSTDGGVKLPFPDSSQDLVMASSMLQYTCDAWRESLREMARVARRYVFISRLPIVRRSPTTRCHQRVACGGRVEHHFFQIFSRDEFEAAVTEAGCNVLKRDYTAEILSVAGLVDPVVLNLYLLTKRSAV